MDELKLTGSYKVRLFDRDGKLLHAQDVKNVITTAGKNFLAAWIAAASQATPFMNYMAIGTSGIAATAADTALGTEVFRKAGVISSNANVWQTTVSYGVGEGAGTIREAGILSASSSGTLMARQTITPFVKDATNILLITWQISLS